MRGVLGINSEARRQQNRLLAFIYKRSASSQRGRVHRPPVRRVARASCARGKAGYVGVSVGGGRSRVKSKSRMITKKAKPLFTLVIWRRRRRLGTRVWPNRREWSTAPTQPVVLCWRIAPPGQPAESHTIPARQGAVGPPGSQRLGFVRPVFVQSHKSQPRGASALATGGCRPRPGSGASQAGSPPHHMSHPASTPRGPGPAPGAKQLWPERARSNATERQTMQVACQKGKKAKAQRRANGTDHGASLAWAWPDALPVLRLRVVILVTTLSSSRATSLTLGHSDTQHHASYARVSA